MRRVQWEARIHAVAIATALGEALGGRRGTGARGGAPRWVPADAMMATMGASWAE